MTLASAEAYTLTLPVHRVARSIDAKLFIDDISNEKNNYFF